MSHRLRWHLGHVQAELLGLEGRHPRRLRLPVPDAGGIAVADGLGVAELAPAKALQRQQSCARLTHDSNENSEWQSELTLTSTAAVSSAHRSARTIQ